MTAQRTLLAALLAGSILAGRPALAATTVVSSISALQTALNTRVSGDIIQVAPGTYTQLQDSTSRNYGPAGITITSQFPTNPAVIGGLNIKNWHFVNFTQMKITPWFTQNAMIDLQSSSDMVFDHVEVYDPAWNPITQGSPGNTVVMGVGTVARVSFTNSLIHDGGGGVALVGSNSTTVNPGPISFTNVEFYNFYHDMVHAALSSNVTFTHTHFHDVFDSGDHADFMQFEDNAHFQDMANITAQDSLFDNPNPASIGAQGPFLHGIGTVYPSGTFFTNAQYLRNVVCVVGQVNALFLTQGINYTIQDNYVSSVSSQHINVVGTGGTVTGNTSNGISVTDPSPVNISNNPVIASPSDCAAAYAVAAATGAGTSGHLGPGTGNQGGAGRLRLKK
jgi:hypothetical protein